MRTLLALMLLLCCSAVAAGQISTKQYRVDVDRDGTEHFAVHDASGWTEALAAATPVRIVSHGHATACTFQTSAMDGATLLVKGACGEAGSFEQRFTPTAEDDVLDVATRVMLKPNTAVESVEDRYSFVPAVHPHVDPLHGPLDFVWSQGIKSERDDLVPTNAFKSPAVMMQQGPIFAAVLPMLSSRHEEQLALDLDVTSERQPWMSFGSVSTEPHDHSYFRRSATPLHQISDTVDYRYSLVLSAAPPKLGYVRVTHLLWQRLGHPALLASPDAQRDVLRPELMSFASWRNEAWHTYADRVYRSFPCGQRTCGTLTSDRNYKGDWEHTEPDAWFNAWFQTLRTAYGWYVYGRDTHDTAMMRKAEGVLNLALSSPQKQGAFPTIYLLNGAKWIPEDGWAGYADSYHAFCMSWTAYWMLRWAEDLVPGRKQEILTFVSAYGDFLLKQQHADGVIPSWYYADSLRPREEFRDFNAETAPSALLLAELGMVSGRERYTRAAERGMHFVEQEVVPRQRWFDFETYLSCARKDYGFFDRWTAQYPQNNLAEIQAPQAMLALYKATHQAEYLEQGRRMLDYLLLTQQVWPNPAFTPNLIGGFTTQNTDAEWSDARQGYAATLLLDYYDATGEPEYLERAVAAARSTFAVAPWENWAHTGDGDGPGALTGFHWGTGSAMTSVELMAPELGDAIIDLKHAIGIGFDESTVRDLEVHGKHVAFTIASPDTGRSFHVRFRGANPNETYMVRWNGGAASAWSGTLLMSQGVTVQPTGSR